VSNNQQRRDAAKRKLQRQNERRVHQAKALRQRLMIVGVVAAVLVIVGAVYLFSNIGKPSGNAASGDTATTEPTTDAAGTSAAATDAAATGATDSTTAAGTGACSYPTSGTAAKDVTPPTDLHPATTGTVDATLALNSGDVTLQLDRAAAPCTVNSFVSLAGQHYFDGTTCHRLTSSASLKVLQCGDPTGTGTGGPGYSFADELTGSETYGEGTLAMANAGPDTNGSQFFLVYGDSTLPPDYTVFGKVTGGLDVVKKIADTGTTDGGQDGAPKNPVTIEKVTVGS
jgi:peptidyl-prolyl cis-trans isomerase B (cyclophilin B)